MSFQHSQSLYTAVFPSVTLPVRRSPLSEPSSSPPSSAPRSSNLISSLSRLHLSLSSVPAELSPSLFEESEAGAAVHRLKIENALREAKYRPSNGDWCQLYKLVDMTCTRSKFRNSQAQISHHNVDEGIPWILAETEEEWQEWETAHKLSKLKKTKSRIVKEAIVELEDADVKTSPSKSKAIKEKVSSWKAQVEKSATVDAKRPSPLGFSVVKPSTVASSTKKSKGASIPKPSQEKTTNSKPPPKQDLPNPPQLPSTAKSPQKQTSPKSPQLSGPTFSQVLTSTPVKKGAVNDKLPLFFASQVTPESVKGIRPIDHAQKPPERIPLFEPSQITPRKEVEVQPLFDPSSPEAMHIVSPVVTTNKRLRPMTPPSDDHKSPAFMQTQAMFQTQAVRFRPAKRTKLATSPTTSHASPPSSSRTPAKSTVASGSSPNKMAITPARGLGKARGVFNFKTPVKHSAAEGSSPDKMVITPSRSVSRGLGNAKGLFDVDIAATTTPEKMPPTLTELLASSQRSKPRPRPPSRKAPVTPSKSGSPSQGMQLTDEDEVEDVPPSPKTYFSSPASSDSSSAGSSFNFRVKNPRFSPPRSPCFTQRPESFAPALTGTQPNGSGGGGVGKTSSLKRGGSGSLGMFGYNSQFDVDGNVDEVSAMLERDVDVDHWFKDIPTDE